MTEPHSPPRRPMPPTAEPDRETRLAEALRANLHRRKAQARARRDPGPPAADTADEEG